MHQTQRAFHPRIFAQQQTRATRWHVATAQWSYDPAACGDLLARFVGERATTYVVIDGCGKGPEAASLARHFLDLATAEMRDGGVSAASFHRWNAAALDCFADGTFVAVTIAECLHTLPLIRIWNAGNPAPLLLRGERATSIDAPGMLIGVHDAASYEAPKARVVRMRAGDELLLFTDGLIDQRSGGGRVGNEGVQRCM